MNEYNLIFKRKSFHIFKDTEEFPINLYMELIQCLPTLKPLDPTIRTGIKIVPAKEAAHARGGAQYCIEFFSEEKGEYLRNIGYMGEQLDLWLAGKDIGALWLGMGKPDVREKDGLKFVIMIAIAKVPGDTFRKDMFKAKRKPLEEIWKGETLGVAEIVRFAPSACNTQPWFVESGEKEITVYRKSGKRGIMPAALVHYYNRIDIGIFLYFLELCLEHEGYSYQRTDFEDSEMQSGKLSMVAKYKVEK